MNRFAYVAALLLVVPLANAREPRSSASKQLSANEACGRLKSVMAQHDGVPAAQIQKTWFCDPTPWDEHPGWMLIGLRSYRQCEGICSNLRGWFYVKRSTGEIREAVGDFEIGPKVGHQ